MIVLGVCSQSSYWQLRDDSGAAVSKTDELCIQNEELCIKNEEFCI